MKKSSSGLHNALRIACALGLGLGLVACDPAPVDEDAGAADAGTVDAAGTDSNVSGTGTLSGQILDSLGNGVGEAAIAVGDLSATADWEGHYEVQNVPAGAATIAVSADWFVDKDQQTSVVADTANSVDISLVARSLEIQSADRSLADSYATGFDWTSDTASVSIVETPTRAKIDLAIYHRNPALYVDPGGESQVTPATLPSIVSGTASGFDFTLGSGAPNEGQQALDLASIVDTMAETPLTTAEQASALYWEPAIDIYLVNWDILKSLNLYFVNLAVRGQKWGGASVLPTQALQHTYLHSGEIWVKLSFADFLDLGTGITDSDGDGEREIFARVTPAHFDTEVYSKLLDDYVTPVYDTLGLRDDLQYILDNLYSRTSPSLIRIIGEPYEISGLGTFAYPHVGLEHSDATVNGLLVGP